MSFCTFHVPVCRKCLKIRLKSNSQGIVYVILVIHHFVKVYGLSGLYVHFLQFFYDVRHAICKNIGPGVFAIRISQNIPVHPYKPYSSFISFSDKREKKMLLHYCTFCTIAISTKVRKCKSAKCKQYLTLHFEGWSGFNSSNSFSLLFLVGIFFSKAKGISVANLKCVDSYQIKGQDSR